MCGNFRETVIKDAWPHKKKEKESALSLVECQWIGSAVKQAFVSERPGV